MSLQLSILCPNYHTYKRIIDQCPSLLSLPARGNTWATFVLNLKDAKDVNSAASALLLEASDKKILGRLDTGQAVVKLQGRWYRPFTVNIPLVPIKKGSILDNMLYEIMRPYSAYINTDNNEISVQDDIPFNRDLRKEKTEISIHEMKLIEDINDHPFSGIVERYKRIGWSCRKGN